MEHTFEENILGFEHKEVILGIDEAGRGPVLGPMVYACLFYPKENEDLLKKINVDDSKRLSSQNRDKIYDKIKNLKDKFGWRIHIMSPEYLSCEMHRKKKNNLNEISHLAAISKFIQINYYIFMLLDLIKYVINNKVNVKEIYIDTVGPPDSYRNKLINIFPGINITVKPKADSLFPSVSGASILAKVKRDDILSNWWGQTSIECCDFNGNKISNYEQGSGYPGDPKTREFLRRIFDPIFGFPNIVRFSWSTASEIIEKSGYSVTWGENELNNSQQKIEFNRPQKNCKLFIF
ncbi:ribonuclease HI large subunit [Cryptosporidium ubiquitum]|uniref:Ribonuclease n=1 Tax=Cryptosporidium ubiquitum TaxID=857276 RepID=A0A1J4MCT1_9CRYT|nr:ribonuclease HI large subunit [Cryptosporidium ubiquitum]OII72042.1 ribonuclease HI large subunit [Cryptosporidium ubiquitum]